MFLPKALSMEMFSVLDAKQNSLYMCGEKISKTLHTDVFVFTKAGITITIVQCLEVCQNKKSVKLQSVTHKNRLMVLPGRQ